MRLPRHPPAAALVTSKGSKAPDGSSACLLARSRSLRTHLPGLGREPERSRPEPSNLESTRSASPPLPQPALLSPVRVCRPSGLETRRRRSLQDVRCRGRCPLAEIETAAAAGKGRDPDIRQAEAENHITPRRSGITAGRITIDPPEMASAGGGSGASWSLASVSQLRLPRSIAGSVPHQGLMKQPVETDRNASERQFLSPSRRSTWLQAADGDAIKSGLGLTMRL